MLGAPQKLPALRGGLAESATAARADAKARDLTGTEAAAFVAAHRFDLAVDHAADLRNGTSTGRPEDTLARLLGNTLPRQAEVAARHGLKLAMHEGGTHVAGQGAAVEDAELAAFFTHLDFTPGMGAPHDELLTGWAGIPDQRFNAFVDVYRPNRWGSWGALRHLWDANPRRDALARGCGRCRA